MASTQLAEQKQENRQLKAKFAETKDQEFVETQARNKLFLVRSGESVVVLPKVTSEAQSKNALPLKPNWQQWIALFH